MVSYKLLIVLTVCAVAAHCEDCFVGVKDGEKSLQFDLTSLGRLKSADFIQSDGSYSIHVQMCNSHERNLFCNGTRSNVCLIKNERHAIDIGSKIKDELETSNFERSSEVDNNAL